MESERDYNIKREREIETVSSWTSKRQKRNRKEYGQSSLE
jgi:hypothetical protein